MERQRMARRPLESSGDGGGGNAKRKEAFAEASRRRVARRSEIPVMTADMLDGEMRVGEETEDRQAHQTLDARRPM